MDFRSEGDKNEAIFLLGVRLKTLENALSACFFKDFPLDFRGGMWYYFNV